MKKIFIFIFFLLLHPLQYAQTAAQKEENPSFNINFTVSNSHDVQAQNSAATKTIQANGADTKPRVIIITQEQKQPSLAKKIASSAVTAGLYCGMLFICRGRMPATMPSIVSKNLSIADASRARERILELLKQRRA